MVLERNTDVGSQVGPNTVLGRLVATDEYWIVANIPQASLQWLRFPEDGTSSSPVRITSRSAWPHDAERTGELLRVLGTLDTDTRMARVLISVRDPLALTPENAGFWAMNTVQKEVYPEFELDIVSVRVAYPGAAPSEVEQGVLRPIEAAIRGVDGIAEITSTAWEGAASVDIELVAGIDRMRIFRDVDQAVNQIRTFPDDIDQPSVNLRSTQRRVMLVGLYGDLDYFALRRLAEDVRDQLVSTPGITQVAIERVPDYVTYVDVSADALREYGLTMQEIGQVISSSSLDVPAGSVETQSGEILLRVSERRQWAEEFAEIEVVSSSTGGRVMLGEIATLRDGFEDVGFIGEFNGALSVDISVYRVGDQSPLEVADRVQETMRGLEATLPPGVQWRIDSNAAEDYRQRLTLLTENAVMAVFIVLGVLAIFLNYRLAFWVMMGMLVSFVGGMTLMPAVGVSLNMVSMFGFLVVLGIVVDDAVVVGENVYEYRKQGMSPVDAAIAGARDIARPVSFAILTNIIAFVPLIFIPGPTGKYWYPLPIVVMLVLAVSLIDALFILPAHLAHSKEPTRGLAAWADRVQQRFATFFDYLVERFYSAFIDLCLRNRYVVTTMSVTLLVVVGAYALSDHMGIVQMPEEPADEIEAGVRLPTGSTIEDVGNVARLITASTRRMFDEHDLWAQAEGVKTNVRGRSFVDVEIVLLPPDQRTMTADEIIELWRAEMDDIPGVDQITFEAERGFGGWRQDVEIDLGHGDVEVLQEVADALRAELETFDAVVNVTDNLNRRKAQLDFTLRPEARLLGLTSNEVGRQLRNAYFGGIALRQLRGTNEFEVRVRLPDDERTDLQALEAMVLRTPSGVEVPLVEVVDLTYTEGFGSISRRAGRRVVTMGFDVEPPSALNRVIETIDADVLPGVRADYPGLTWTFEGSDAEMREATQALYTGYLLALFVIYALLAVALNSYLQPILVMFAIPFGLVGAILGHLLLGYTLSLVSLMGVIALSGVVLNDSLIMIDYANKRRDKTTIFAAIREAGIRRFRPIMLTTVTTFAGLSPIILESSGQARQVIPMAISLGFGIVFATTIILVLVPCLYLILEDGRRVFGGEE